MRANLFKVGIALIAIAGLGSCTIHPAKYSSPNFQPFFGEYGVQGCFLIYDMKKDVYQIYNSTRCEQGFLPASTFKILNAMIGLETGVITGEDMVIPWDGVERSVPEWNRNHNLTTPSRSSQAKRARKGH